MHLSQPTIFIIGAGAIGKALAVFLKRAGRKPVLLRGSVTEGSRYIQPLRVETHDGTVLEEPIEVATLSDFDHLDGMVVLASKSYGNQRLAALLTGRTGASPIILLQNGLGIEQPFLERGFPELYRGVLFATSQPIDPQTVRFRPVAVSPIGVERGEAARLDYLVQQLHTPDFEFAGSPDIQPVIWKKGIINSVFNSVCSLLEVDNGVFHRSGAALQIARRIMAECLTIAREKGIFLREEDMEESLLHISRASDGQLISTLQDIRLGRKTEIETLNLEIVNLAQSLNKGQQVVETGLLGELTALKAALSLHKPQNPETE